MTQFTRCISDHNLCTGLVLPPGAQFPFGVPPPGLMMPHGAANAVLPPLAPQIGHWPPNMNGLGDVHDSAETSAGHQNGTDLPNGAYMGVPHQLLPPPSQPQPPSNPTVIPPSQSFYMNDQPNGRCRVSLCLHAFVILCMRSSRNATFATKVV